MGETPRALLRTEYRPPDFWVDAIDLRFALDPEATIVRSRMVVRRNSDAAGASLRLDGDQLTLLSVALDGRVLKRDGYQLHGDGTLEIAVVPDRFQLDIETYISPQANHSLSGLYVSGGAFFTQCEAQGFRRITYMPDRPDVMAIYSTTMVADRAQYPVLLSNGNLVASGIDGDRHWARWVDPHPKPSYLFALVAGDLVAVRDRFLTRSGRDVALAIWVRAGDEDRCDHAMQALKASMRWDEDVYGLEYDLDMFNIAAVADFNMGAMENKGLNIFNTKYVLARPETATDSELEAVEAVIAHEYFHNWTGNRITCRDWFQLSLKEGLTVFRDQQFSADQGSAALQRIREARRLRATQFPEDAGPLAHPVRPESYIAVDNLYTTTVYEKGAEIVRMVHTLLGAAKFRAGMDLYVARHDNSAATIEDFLQAMQDAGGAEVTGFLAWYGRAGTPEVTVSEEFNADTKCYKIIFRRSADLPIPMRFGLLGPDGEEIARRELVLNQTETQIAFDNITHRPVPSLLRGFCAPVKMRGQSPAQLLFLAKHDQDSFVRWDATQQVAIAAMLTPGGAEAEGLVAGFAAALASNQDPAFVAELVTLPSVSLLADQMAVVDPDALHLARENFRAGIAHQLRPALLATCDRLQHAPDAATRALRNACLNLLGADDAAVIERAAAQFDRAANMTDVGAALMLLVASDNPHRLGALERFYHTWRDDPLVLDKWFAVQASTSHIDTGTAVRALAKHPDFSLRNPNRVRALVSSFSANQLHFHAKDGAGYRFLSDMVINVDADNGQNAARMVIPLTAWRRLEPTRSALMQSELERIANIPNLSSDTLEKIEKALNG